MSAEKSLTKCKFDRTLMVVEPKTVIERIGPLVELVAVLLSAIALWQTLYLWRNAKESLQVSRDQWKVAESALTLQREQFYLGQRAYISVNDVKPAVPIKADTLNVAIVTFKNTGQTPANGVAYTFRFLLQETPPTLEYGSAEGGSNLGAGEIIPSPMPLPLFTATNIARMTTGEMRLYLVGRLQYVTALSKPDSLTAKAPETQFCSVYEPRAKVFLRCPFGNDAY